MEEKPSMPPREYRPMELFVLALIGQMELTSLYAFRQEAGLEPGAIRTVLQRLEKENLIERAATGRRRRRALAITPEGRAVLEENWREQMKLHLEPEAVLRMCLVAGTMAGPDAMIRYLLQASQYRASRAGMKRSEAEYLAETIDDPLSTYAWMRAMVEADRYHSEQEAFKAISQTMEKHFFPERSREVPRPG